MVEIRFHGRGGQGTVIASEILACALFSEGRFVQSFPTFGVERRGAPVGAFVRIDDIPIRLRCQIEEPDHVVILDATLISAMDVLAGLKQGGWALINSSHAPEDFQDFLDSGFKVATVDASRIAVEHNLGSSNDPIVNTAILGALSSITGLVGLDAVLSAIREGVPVKADENAAAAVEAAETVRISMQDRDSQVKVGG
jgi:2-oxoacid:acceptor oxidoreductase gamma subunit (pyruvate/2-ketoisovalerate family)